MSVKANVSVSGSGSTSSESHSQRIVHTQVAACRTASHVNPGDEAVPTLGHGDTYFGLPQAAAVAGNRYPLPSRDARTSARVSVGGHGWPSTDSRDSPKARNGKDGSDSKMARVCKGPNEPLPSEGREAGTQSLIIHPRNCCCTATQSHVMAPVVPGYPGYPRHPTRPLDCGPVCGTR